jgi:hypothetical protein
LVLFVGDKSDISNEKAAVFRESVARLKVLDEREKDTRRLTAFYEVDYTDPITAHWLGTFMGNDAKGSRFPDVL